MTIRQLKYPKVIKLDRRYRNFSAGFKYRLDFDIGPWSNDGRSKWTLVLRWCENTYGPEREYPTESAPRWIVNDNYRVRVPRNKYYRQLFLKQEQDVTMLLLTVE